MTFPQLKPLMYVFILVLLAINFYGSASFEPIQVMCELNGFLIPAMVDTGAEITVMSAACAKRCRLSECIDTQYSGKAIGVGTGDIIGAINEQSMRIGPVSFLNKLSILRNSRCDMLIGLDVLRRFKCEINIGENVMKLSVRRNSIRIPLVTYRLKSPQHLLDAQSSIDRLPTATITNLATRAKLSSDDSATVGVAKAAARVTSSVAAQLAAARSSENKSFHNTRRNRAPVTVTVTVQKVATSHQDRVSQMASSLPASVDLCGGFRLDQPTQSSKGSKEEELIESDEFDFEKCEWDNGEPVTMEGV